MLAQARRVMNPELYTEMNEMLHDASHHLASLIYIQSNTITRLQILELDRYTLSETITTEITADI